MNESWLGKLLKEDNILIIIPAIFVVLTIAAFMVYGFSEPTYAAVPKTLTTLDEQVISEQLFYEKYQEKAHTISNPFVVVNPYQISPLSALIMFDTDTSEQYVLKIKGKTAEADLEYKTTLTTFHTIPVYGLYPDYVNVIELYEYDSDLDEKGVIVATFTIKTDPLQEGAFEPTEIQTTFSYFGNDWMLLMPATSNLPVAVDAFGDVRWYLNEPLAFSMKPLENGHFLVGGDRIISSPYYTTSLFEMDLMGKIYTEYYIPGGFHHDFVELANGNFLVLTNDFEGTVEDIVVEIDRTTGEIVDTWDISDYLSHLDGMSQMWTTTDWFHNNSIDYNESTDSILLSGRHQDVVISINKTTKELEYVIGDPENWDSEFVDNYFLTPVGSDFEWSYAQHSAIYLPNGDIFLFDNGNNRSKNSDTYVSANNNYSRGVIYRVDRNAMEITQLYQYGRNLGNNFYSPYISNVDYYGDNHYMIHSGGIARTLEGSLNIPAPLYDGDLEVQASSVTVELDQGTLMYRLVMPDNYYRALRVSADEHVSFGLGGGVRLGHMMKTEPYTGDVRTKFTVLRYIPTKYDVQFTKETDRFIVEGIFHQEDIIYLVLESKTEQYTYHIPTSQTAFTAMCTAIFSTDERFITYYVNEEQMSGTYTIHLIVNGHRYNSYQEVTFN